MHASQAEENDIGTKCATLHSESNKNARASTETTSPWAMVLHETVLCALWRAISHSFPSSAFLRTVRLVNTRRRRRRRGTAEATRFWTMIFHEAILLALRRAVSSSFPAS